MSCSRCNGLGYVQIEEGVNKTCSCKIAEKIKLALSKHPNILLAKDKQFNKELFPLTSVVSANSMEAINSILKVMFTYYFVTEQAKSLDMIDSDSLMEAYFDKSETYSMSSIKDSDFLVLSIEDGKHNKILPEVIMSILNYRNNVIQGRPTWIVFSSFNGAKMKEVLMFKELIQYLDNHKYTFRGLK